MLSRSSTFRSVPTPPSRVSVQIIKSTLCLRSTTMSTFLSMPLEIRLVIYANLLSDHKDTILHNNQPSNDHLILLRTCRQVDHEAGNIAGFRAYLSLRHERQITAFLNNAETHIASCITHLDVANDGRMVKHPNTDRFVSSLILAAIPEAGPFVANS